MKGYLRNESNEAYFKLQRQIPPGGKVTLDAAYRSAGKASGVEEGPEFVQWLKEHILTQGTWGIYEEEGKIFGAESESPKIQPSPDTKQKSARKAKTNSSANRTSSKKEHDARGAGRAMRRDSNEAKGLIITPATIIDAPYDEARTLIEKTKDRTVLKKALNLTKHFSGKDQHMRHIMKRLDQVY